MTGVDITLPLYRVTRDNSGWGIWLRNDAQSYVNVAGVFTSEAIAAACLAQILVAQMNAARGAPVELPVGIPS